MWPSEEDEQTDVTHAAFASRSGGAKLLKSAQESASNEVFSGFGILLSKSHGLEVSIGAEADDADAWAISLDHSKFLKINQMLKLK